MLRAGRRRCRRIAQLLGGEGPLLDSPPSGVTRSHDLHPRRLHRQRLPLPDRGGVPATTPSSAGSARGAAACRRRARAGGRGRRPPPESVQAASEQRRRHLRARSPGDSRDDRRRADLVIVHGARAPRRVFASAPDRTPRSVHAEGARPALRDAPTSGAGGGGRSLLGSHRGAPSSARADAPCRRPVTMTSPTRSGCRSRLTARWPGRSRRGRSARERLVRRRWPTMSPR